MVVIPESKGQNLALTVLFEPYSCSVTGKWWSRAFALEVFHDVTIHGRAWYKLWDSQVLVSAPISIKYNRFLKLILLETSHY